MSPMAIYMIVVGIFWILGPIIVWQMIANEKRNNPSDGERR